MRRWIDGDDQYHMEWADEVAALGARVNLILDTLEVCADFFGHYASQTSDDGMLRKVEAVIAQVSPPNREGIEDE